MPVLFPTRGRRSGALATVLVLVAALAEPAAATDPAIARPRYTIGSKEHFGGTAFFFESREHGVIAVAAAHSFPLHKLGRAEELEFISGGLRSVLARSTRDGERVPRIHGDRRFVLGQGASGPSPAQLAFATR